MSGVGKGCLLCGVEKGSVNDGGAEDNWHHLALCLHCKWSQSMVAEALT